MPERARHSSKYKSRSSEERDDEEGHEVVSEDEIQLKSISSEDQASPIRVVSTLLLIVFVDCFYVLV